MLIQLQLIEQARQGWILPTSGKGWGSFSRVD